MLPFYEKSSQDIRYNQCIDLNFPAHFHQEIELVLVLSGALTLKIEDKERTLTTGEVALIFPHCVHSYQTTDNSSVYIYIIDYQLIPDFEKIFSKYIPLDSFIPSPDDLLKKYLIEAQSLRKSVDLAQNFLFNATWYMIFSLLLQQITLKKRTLLHELPLVHQIISFIFEHSKESLSLKKIAQNVNCSEYTVSKIFSHKIGTSFPSYLERIRISNAKELLNQTPKLITEIAYDVGFDTTRSFNRSFLKLEGLTPSDYRKSTLPL